MEKVTMQDIADKINISRISVWKAFNRPDKVSENLRKQVMDTAAELGYITSPAVQSMTAMEHSAVSIVVSRPDSSLFWTTIIHQVAKEFAKKGTDLMYTYAPTAYKPEFKNALKRTAYDSEGIIVLNIYNEQMLELINKIDVPKVFLDTATKTDLTSLTGDVLLIEGIETTESITQSLIDRGCKRIGFIGDIGYAHTNFDRFTGFKNAMSKNSLTLSEDDCLTHFSGINSYQNDIENFMHTFTKFPDGFVCASDYIAHLIYNYCLENSISIPHDLMLTGYDNSREYGNIAGKITTADVDTRSIGKKLASELMFRIANPDAPISRTYIYPHLLYY